MRNGSAEEAPGHTAAAARIWDRRLERLGAELESNRIFLAGPGRIVVLDTSALMEGVLFTGYDWHTLDAGLATEAVRLIVPILVIEELDGLKRTRDRQQKANAKEVLHAMWALHRRPWRRR